MIRRALHLVAAVGLTAAAGLVVPAPAAAAACSSAEGVTVVVDFHELGDGLHQVCDPDGGGDSAASLFPANGFPLDYVQRQPGFVCRVSGEPADDPCVNTPPPDAYWGLWWSDGESSAWTYSSEGAGSLNIPEGGSVAFSWNGSETKTPPGADPATHADEPSPTPATGPGGGGGGQGGPGAGGSGGGPPSTADPSGTSTASPSDDPSRRERDGARAGGRKQDRDEESDGPSDEPSDSSPTTMDPTPVADPASSADDASLPAWVAPTVAGSLFAVAGVVALVRRRMRAG